MSEPRESNFEPPNLQDAPPLYLRFWSLWREEKFFECHEVLEELWRATPGPERWFYNGLIHCAVSIYQHRRGNAVGAARQLVRAQVKIAPLSPRFGGVDTAALLAHVEQEVTPSLAALSESQRAQLTPLRERLESAVVGVFPGGKFEGGGQEWFGF